MRKQQDPDSPLGGDRVKFNQHLLAGKAQEDGKSGITGLTNKQQVTLCMNTAAGHTW